VVHCRTVFEIVVPVRVTSCSCHVHVHVHRERGYNPHSKCSETGSSTFPSTRAKLIQVLLSSGAAVMVAFLRPRCDLQVDHLPTHLIRPRKLGSLGRGRLCAGHVVDSGVPVRGTAWTLACHVGVRMCLPGGVGPGSSRVRWEIDCKHAAIRVRGRKLRYKSRSGPQFEQCRMCNHFTWHVHICYLSSASPLPAPTPAQPSRPHAHVRSVPRASTLLCRVWPSMEFIKVWRR
jgi:hypothetical protein